DSVSTSVPEGSPRISSIWSACRTTERAEPITTPNSQMKMNASQRGLDSASNSVSPIKAKAIVVARLMPKNHSPMIALRSSPECFGFTRVLPGRKRSGSKVICQRICKCGANHLADPLRQMIGLRQGRELRDGAFELQFDGAGRAMALLADDDLGAAVDFFALRQPFG